MKNRYNYENALFLSARIRAREKELITKEELSDMAAVSDMDELYRMLYDRGIVPESDPENGKSYDRALFERLFKAYSSVFSDVTDKRALSLFIYPYDCHNLKAAIKYAQKGESGIGAMIPLGTVPPTDVEKAVRCSELSGFPRNMALAALRAEAELSRSGEAQTIDLMLDRACFMDVSEALYGNKVPFMSELFRVKADTVNISTALRLAGVTQTGALRAYENAFVCGGGISKSAFIELFDRKGALDKSDTVSDIFAMLRHTEYSEISNALKSGKCDIGKICDDIYISKAREAKGVLAGIEVLAGYLVASEYEVKNLRILISGKQTKTNRDVIIKRFREGYA